jgi:hypothetical protein
MASLARMVWLAGALSFAAGAITALAVAKGIGGDTGVRDPGDLPGFEDKFAREFRLQDSKRALVRAILRDYREKRRAIEGQAASVAHDKLERAGRDADSKLRGILPPAERQRYDQWLVQADLDGGGPQK